MIQPYAKKIEKEMAILFERLSEKDRRIYAAIEVRKLPWGGLNYIAEILNCNHKTIQKGVKELLSSNDIPPGRIRRKGGGRMTIIESNPGIDKTFIEIIKDYTAGDPMNRNIRWTNLTHKEISEKLTGKGFKSGEKIAKQLLKKHGYVKRKAKKTLSIGKSNDRNEQFENIAEIKAEYEKSDNPIISVDTKKKECFGNFGHWFRGRAFWKHGFGSRN